MSSPLDADLIGSPATRTRLTLMHGFSQTRRCWGPFADLLAERYPLLLVDAPGHGGSEGVIADVASGAELWGQTAGGAVYLGYSMGGRHALRLAVDRPDLVEALVLIGASPGIDDDQERAARCANDAALADHLEQVGIGRFLTEWLAQPLFATLPTSASHLDERRTNTVEGLATSLRNASSGAQEPLWDRLRGIDIPVLMLVGALDERYTTIAHRMHDAIGENAMVRVIADAGHAAHLEQPEASARAVVTWLERNV